MSHCQQQFSTPPSSLPAAYRQHAANLARWFPEVLLALGAPGLEESFVPNGPHVTVGPAGQTIEVVLDRRPPSHSTPLVGVSTGVSTVVQPSSGPVTAPPAKSLSTTLAGLEALAMDFEALAAGRFSRPWPLSHPQDVDTYSTGPPKNTDEGLLRRLDNAAEEILNLTTQLQVSGVLFPNSENTDMVAKEQPVAPTTEKVRIVSPVQSPPSSSRDRKRERAGNGHLKKYSSAPACADPDHEVAFVKELTPCTPGSARGGQAHQGQAAARQAGRSRALPKAALWRTQRDSVMKISINKVPTLKEEPASPKFQKSTKVWGSSSSKGRSTARRSTMQMGDPCEDRSAAAIKARIDRKLSLLFGPSKVARSQSISPHDQDGTRRQVSA